MVVDSHVHLRDFRQADKETIKHGLEVARDSGVSGVFDMPNTDPPIMTEELVLERLKLADDVGVPEVFYGVYMGLTSDPEQVKRAVDVYRKFFPRVVGFKLYAGHSVGQLGVIGVDKQSRVYETLAQEGYDGFFAVHPEKEESMHPKIWTPNSPVSHCFARPEGAEVDSVRDQIYLAVTRGFRGKLHMAHVSSPKAVDEVVKAKNEWIDISCGVCPHHLIYDWTKMFDDNGIIWKMNPPLREPGSPNKMLRYLKEGKIDWIETDHAPHTLEQKTENPWMSGVTGLASWPTFIEYLRRHDFSEDDIDRVTYRNIVERLSFDIERNTRYLKDRRRDYPINFYAGLESELGINVK